MIVVIDRAGWAVLPSPAQRSSRCDCGLLVVDRSVFLGTNRSAVIIDRQTLCAATVLARVLSSVAPIEPQDD